MIVEENTEYGAIIGNPQAPTLNQLANRYGLATQYFGTIHSQTDALLKSTVDETTQSKLWLQGNNAIVVTFDEGDTSLGCCDANPGGGQVATIVIRNHQQHSVQDATPYNHYSLVATLQAVFGLGCQLNGTAVGLTCDAANGVVPMTQNCNSRLISSFI